jgi:general secretion pathway protein G
VLRTDLAALNSEITMTTYSPVSKQAVRGIQRSAGARAAARAVRGFSLLELMLVLAIIGVLTAVVAVNVVGAGGKAKMRASMASMTTLKTALSSYNLDNSAYPPDLKTLQAGGTKAYLDPSIKIADGWSRQYYYNTPGLNNQPYDLISFGEDGQSGTEDDINVWAMQK